MTEETIQVNIELPKNLLDTVKWYSNLLEKSTNDYIVEAIRSDLDSQLCSNCETVSKKIAEELRNKLKI